MTTTIDRVIGINEVKRLNEEVGHHFFSAGSMRFFRSRVAGEAYVSRDGARAYFVTSEQFVSGCYRARRTYTVRVCYLEGAERGKVHTVGDFNAIENGAKAKRIAKTEAAK